MKLYNKLKKSEDIDKIIKQKFWLFESLDKFYNIIINIHSSADHTAKFLKLAERMISLDNYIRWNSWYLSLIITNKHILLINIYFKSHFDKLFKDYLTLPN